ncbi:MAG: carboxymuconolactone decarboxylase family protein [Halobacteriota archaeon]
MALFQRSTKNSSATRQYSRRFFISQNGSRPILHCQHLPRNLSQSAAAASLGSEYCLETHIQGAKRLGAQDDQIALAILIGASVAETTALSKSLRVWERSRV